jgi:hypothetical protein
LNSSKEDDPENKPLYDGQLQSKLEKEKQEKLENFLKKKEGSTTKGKKTTPPQVLTPEQEWKKLVDEANKEDPWHEPIKDLIDQYAEQAEDNRKSEKQRIVHELELEEKNKNNYGASKPKVEEKKESKKNETSKS